MERCTRWIDGDVDRVDENGYAISLTATCIHGYDGAQTGRSHYIGTLGVVALLSCSIGGACRMPASGGPCTVCGFPMAFAHPDCVDDALDHVDALYVNGTALFVMPSVDVMMGFVKIVQHNGNQHFLEIANAPNATDEDICAYNKRSE